MRQELYISFDHGTVLTELLRSMFLVSGMLFGKESTWLDLWWACKCVMLSNRMKLGLLAMSSFTVVSYKLVRVNSDKDEWGHLLHPI